MMNWELEIISAEPEKLLGKLTEQGISLFSVECIDSLTVRFQIRSRDYPSVTAACAVSSSKWKIIRKKGFFRKFRPLLTRPILAASLLMVLVAMIYLPTRVLFVSVEGNTRIPANQILEAAEDCGICFGASRQNVRSEKVKNELLSAIPGLQWAGVNTYGCTAILSVKEREEVPNTENSNEIASIVAACDALITSCTTTRGNPLCKPGQAVKQGELLISPYLDCGRVIRIISAEGEVYGQTLRSTSVVTPEQCIKITGSGISHRNFCLLLGKKRINLWKDSGIYDATCGRMYEEYYITLPGGFSLPFGIGRETIFHRETTQTNLPQEQIAAELNAWSLFCLDSQAVACEVLSKSETLYSQNGLWILEARYVCTEMIGRVMTEKIGETNEQNN